MRTIRKILSFFSPRPRGNPFFSLCSEYLCPIFLFFPLFLIPNFPVVPPLSLHSDHSVLPGADVLLRRGLIALNGRRVGVVCNQTSVLANGVHLVDTLLSLKIDVVALFAPEHGIRGAASAGETVNDSLDSKTGLPVYSLYGRIKKPAPVMLRNIDVLLFDLQDVGARYYTYASTMAYCMEACAEQGKTFMILDRPNPINGIDIEGPVIDSTLESFIGMFPVPIRHGMTLAEMASMAVGERWLALPKSLDLRIVAMEGWQRTMWYEDTGLPWAPPSPNMKSISTAVAYPGACLFEATNLSEGRGTEKPFEYIGAPWIDAKLLADSMNSRKLKGIQFKPVSFTPIASPSAPTPRFNGMKCNGVFLQVTERAKFLPVQTGVMLLAMIQRLYPGKLDMQVGNFERLYGRRGFWESILSGTIPSLQNLNPVIDAFRGKRAKYLIY